MNPFLDIFFLTCQAWETIYMDWKAYWVRELSRQRLDEYIPF